MTNVNKSVQIPCPKCGRELKLPDRSLLGRKGQCPKCAHTFILEEPSIVTLELAEPDSAIRRSPSTPEIPPPPPFMAKPAKPLDELETPGFETVSEFAAIGEAASAKPGLSKSLKRRSWQRNLGPIIGGVLVLVVVGVLAFTNLTSKRTTSTTQSDNQSSQASNDSSDTEDQGEVATVDPTATEYAQLGNPTKGKPIDLQYIPFGTQVVVNLRPADLWKPSSLGEEIRFCAPPMAKLVETTLSDLFKLKPEDVEELLICLIPGQRGTMPDLAVVAHTKDEQKRSQLIEHFGQRIDTYSQPYYTSNNRAYMIPDLKTLVVGPKAQVDEMFEAIKNRSPSPQIDPLLPMTDRSRHLTVILTPETLLLQDAWYPDNVRPLVRGAVEWLGDEVETIAWSFQLTDELFYSDLLIRHRGRASKRYEQDFKRKLSGLAAQLMPIISHMNPKESGKRMVIGRLPAMVEVFSMATIPQHGAQHVQFTTPLPDRAAPNLVLGTVLAWDESTRTDFSNIKPIAPTESANVPALVADRLNLKIEVDFRAAPFNEAFAYIGGEIKTPIDIDGDALKTGGFTKNIKQEFKMDSVRVLDVIVRIFEDSKGVDKNPEKNLVLVIDESKKRILVTTSAGAERKGLKPFEIKK